MQYYWHMVGRLSNAFLSSNGSCLVDRLGDVGLHGSLGLSAASTWARGILSFCWQVRTFFFLKSLCRFHQELCQGSWFGKL